MKLKTFYCEVLFDDVDGNTKGMVPCNFNTIYLNSVINLDNVNVKSNRNVFSNTTKLTFVFQSRRKHMLSIQVNSVNL